ncbi:MAG: class I SAM-dependent methyltransferase [Alphaproteobacteria bacterium]|nr:class I SAM-dependent methyltransferase [Alphaproteobacteria bacterium]
MTHDNEVFESDDAAAIYDHFNRWSASDDFYLDLACKTGGHVLDLGCGTGMLACRVAAAGCRVTGVDPAEAMLRVARRRSGAADVDWVRAAGQTMDLPQRFDLIYMTGHAFQALLTDGDAVSLLANVARHLADGGRFAVDTRNPAARAWLRWTPAMTRTIVDTPEHSRIEQSFDASVDDDLGIVDIAQHERYLDSGTHRVGRSRIRFVVRDHLERLLTRAGLAALAWYGDWHRRPFTPASAEIFVVARRADR